MRRFILIFGTISGLIVILTTIAGISYSAVDESFQFSVWLGYLTMLVALSMIFVAVKRYRDQQQGGVITFGQAASLGMGIAAVAGITYVAVWEIYLAVTDYAYIGDYAQSVIDARMAAGASDADMAELSVEMQEMVDSYANPLFRLPITFLEIFPVGFVIALVSAGILRKSNVLPESA